MHRWCTTKLDGDRQERDLLRRPYPRRPPWPDIFSPSIAARAPSLSAREGVRITPLGHLGERVLVATTAIPTDGLPRTVTVLWRDFSINEHR